MKITVVGTGFIGGILGRALASAGHDVSFASRKPDADDVARDSGAKVCSIEEALSGPEVVILALPGVAVAEFAQRYGDALVGPLVIDATNVMDSPVANSRGSLPSATRYARAFNTLGGENMEHPRFSDGPADMFFSSSKADRPIVETVVGAVGLRPVFIGENQEAILDAVFHLWINLAFGEGRGRRLAFRLLEE